MKPICNDLYQFSSFIPPINLSFHQYLLLTKNPILIHTGNMDQSEKLLPQVKSLLGTTPLGYILVSHYEADECGGLSIFQHEYPEVVTICSALCARELSGFGYKGTVSIKKPEDSFSDTDFEFKFIDYPSEIHLQDGLTFFENKRKIYFSSDLMFRLGEAHDKTIESSWNTEVESIGTDRVPNEGRLSKMKTDLLAIDPNFIAVGHGYCVNVI